MMFCRNCKELPTPGLNGDLKMIIDLHRVTNDELGNYSKTGV